MVARSVVCHACLTDYQRIFKEDEYKDGPGTLASLAGNRYYGDWVDNLKHGYGYLKYSNDDSYEGKFERDLRHGDSKILEDDVSLGFGKFTSASGCSYDGDWESDYRHGKGKYRWSNGDSYEGGFYGNFTILNHI